MCRWFDSALGHQDFAGPRSGLAQIDQVAIPPLATRISPGRAAVWRKSPGGDQALRCHHRIRKRTRVLQGIDLPAPLPDAPARPGRPRFLLVYGPRAPPSPIARSYDIVVSAQQTGRDADERHADIVRGERLLTLNGL